MTAPVIVFDLDGTLADTARDLIRALNAVLALENAPPVPMDKARDLIGAGARPLIERGLALDGKNVDAARLEALYRAFLDYYHAHIAVDTVLFPGVVDALIHLQAVGWRLAVCTNKIETHAVTLLRTLKVDGFFVAVTGKDTFPFSKPDPRHLLQTVERAGGDPARAIMVGDSRTDIDTARAADIPVIAVTFGYTPAPVETFGPDVAIDSFAELPAAVLRLRSRSPEDALSKTSSARAV